MELHFTQPKKPGSFWMGLKFDSCCAVKIFETRLPSKNKIEYVKNNEMIVSGIVKPTQIFVDVEQS